MGGRLSPHLEWARETAVLQGRQVGKVLVLAMGVLAPDLRRPHNGRRHSGRSWQRAGARLRRYAEPLPERNRPGTGVLAFEASGPRQGWIPWSRGHGAHQDGAELSGRTIQREAEKGTRT